VLFNSYSLASEIRYNVSVSEKQTITTHVARQATELLQVCAATLDASHLITLDAHTLDCITPSTTPPTDALYGHTVC
jgi:hypothetical protein